MADDLPPEAMNEIIELICDDQMIAAIQHYRNLRGTSLQDAKLFIEELAARLQETSPENHAPTTEMAEIAELIYAGQKLQAIKRYREIRTTSLYQAKQFIEQWTADLRQKSPERFSMRSTTGCAGVLVCAAIALAVAVAGLMLP